jgi:uncharacterized OB-fold protein
MSAPERAGSADPARFDVVENVWRLIGTTCGSCAALVFGTHAACLSCGSAEVQRTPLAERGHVLGYTVVHRPADDWWGQVPYTLVEACTVDGAVVVASVDARSEGRVRIGDEVRTQTTFIGRPGSAQIAVYQWSVTP